MNIILKIDHDIPITPITRSSTTSAQWAEMSIGDSTFTEKKSAVFAARQWGQRNKAKFAVRTWTQDGVVGWRIWRLT